MTNGGTLIILVDNEIAVQNLTKFGNSKGFTVSSEKKTEKDFTEPSRFRKTAQPQHQQVRIFTPSASKDFRSSRESESSQVRDAPKL